MKRYLVPPLGLSALLLLLAVCCIVSFQLLPIDRGADFGLFAWILLVASVAGYPAFVLINFVDSAFDRFGSWGWVLTGLLIATMAGIGIVRLKDSGSLMQAVTVSLIPSTVIIMPMSFMRRIALSPHRERTTIDPKHITRFDKLFK